MREASRDADESGRVERDPGRDPDWVPFAERERAPEGGGSGPAGGGERFARYALVDPLDRLRARRALALRDPGHGLPDLRETDLRGRRLRRGLGTATAPPPEADEDEGPAPEATTEWIEIVLVDALGEAVADEPYRVQLPDGSLREGRLDAQGRARLDGVPPGSCQVTFPELDAAEWRRA